MGTRHAALAVLFVACSGPTIDRITPVPQTAAGDAAAFGPGLLAASPHELRLELARPAYVTVLRVWQEEGAHHSATSTGWGWYGSMELVYPWGRLNYPAPASHQLRFKPGTRRVGLPVPQAGAYVTEFTSGVADDRPGQRTCELQQRASIPPGARPNTLPRVACGRRVPLTTRRWQHSPAPQLLGTHQVLVIVSDTRLDLTALGQAVDSLDADVTELPALSAALLARHRGPWAAYMARVD